MAKLYPPQINGTIPAFYSDHIKGTTEMVVPFSMNRAVSLYEVKGMELKIKSLNGTLIGVVESSFIDSVEMEATFDVSSYIHKFNIGSYYKIQVAYIEKNTNDIGYYSTVGIIKYTALPDVYIEGLSVTKTNLNKYTYVGVYKQESDPTEKLYSSRFIIYEDTSIFYDSGDVIHNNTDDEYRQEATEEIKIPIELEENKYFSICFEIETTNGVKAKSSFYKIIQRKSLDPSIQAKLVTTLNFNNGYIALTLDDSVDKIISGTFIIARASNINNWKWETIREFRLSSAPPSDFRFEDHTIEQGILYKYSLQQYNNLNGIYSNRIISDIIEADFEDAFLYDGERQLRIRFNPKVSSFKTDIQESKTDTIGYQYPFFTRNSHIYYKEFPISGLISYLMDENELFIKKEEIGIDIITENSELKEGHYQDWQRNRKETKYDETHNLTSRNISAERFFKLNVLNWLNNGKPKSFRSPGEGNYLVRLMNVSLSPNDVLGRMLHTFSCQAYEIAEYNLDNLAYFNIYDPIKTAGTERRWSTLDIKKIIDEQNYDWSDASSIPTWTTVISGVKMTEIFVEDMRPGSVIRVDGEEIEIGVTGSYRAKNETNPFKKIEVNNLSVNDGLITYAYDAEIKDTFSENVEGFVSGDIPCQQFIGTSYRGIQADSSLNLLDYIQNTKTTIVKLNLLRVMKRPFLDGFIDLNYAIDETLEDVVTRIQSYISGENDPFNDGFYFTTTTGEKIYVRDYSNIYNRPYELPLYQLRVRRVDIREQFTEYEVMNLAGETEYKIYKDLKPYTFEQYYIDKHQDRFYPYIGFYFDPRSGQIYQTPDDLFQFWVNDENIDVTDIETWTVKNFEVPKSLILNNGVYAELSYTKQNIEYVFDDQNSTLKDNNAVKNRKIYEENMIAYLLARDNAVTYSAITPELLDYIQNNFPLGSQNITSANYPLTYGLLISNVYSLMQSNGNEYAFGEYYAGEYSDSSTKGLFNLKRAVDDSYFSYLEKLDEAIRRYEEEHA